MARSALRPARIVPGVLTAAAVLLLGGCGSGGGTSGGDAAAAVIKGLDNPFFQLMEQGMDTRAADSGLAVEVQAAQTITDTTGQAERLITLAGQGFGCYIVNPISGTNLVTGLAQLTQDDAPIVNIDSPIDADAAEAADVAIATYVGTDNEEAGALAGERMVEAVGSGTVAVVGGIAGDVTSGARIDGFTASVGGALEVLPTVAADWERQRALTAATDLLAANPDLRGFFAANDDMGLGIARAIASAGRSGEVLVVSVDGNEEALEAVRSGDLDATVAQYPYSIGQLGVQACEAAMAGQELPADVEAPIALVTADVADQALDAFPAPFQAFDNPLDALTE